MGKVTAPDSLAIDVDLLPALLARMNDGEEGEWVFYVRADSVREMERTIRKLANIAGVDLAEMAFDGWVVDLDD